MVCGDEIYWTTLLSKEPKESVRLLINELRVVNLKKIIPEKFNIYERELHTVWCIRALRYLTGTDVRVKAKITFSKKRLRKG